RDALRHPMHANSEHWHESQLALCITLRAENITEASALHCLELAHEITLADFNAVMAQQIVGSRDVKEELWQGVAEQISLTVQAFFLFRAGTQDDFDAFLAVDLIRGDAADERECL
ncbi:hypothetical protein PSYPI_40629, partial [Pseudomonas syringae pv. pisi str. 1704B]